MSDGQRIRFVLSYMTKGSAASWAANWIDEIYERVDNEGEPIYGSFRDFERQLEETFKDHARQQSAQLKLWSLRLEKQSADEFFNEFNTYTHLAGYNRSHDQYLISLLEENIRSSLLDKVYGMSHMPTTFEEWKHTILQFDDQERRYHLILKRRGDNSQNHQKPFHSGPQPGPSNPQNQIKNQNNNKNWQPRPQQQ